MKRFAELLVRTADLAEAEGRAVMDTLRTEGRWLRGYFARLGVSLICLLGAAVLLVAGLVLLGVAEFTYLQEHVGRPAAAALTGLTLILLGALSLWIYYRNTKADSPPNTRA